MFLKLVWNCDSGVEGYMVGTILPEEGRRVDVNYWIEQKKRVTRQQVQTVQWCHNQFDWCQPQSKYQTMLGLRKATWLSWLLALLITWTRKWPQNQCVCVLTVTSNSERFPRRGSSSVAGMAEDLAELPGGPVAELRRVRSSDGEFAGEWRPHPRTCLSASACRRGSGVFFCEMLNPHLFTIW